MQQPSTRIQAMMAAILVLINGTYLRGPEPGAQQSAWMAALASLGLQLLLVLLYGWLCGRYPGKDLSAMAYTALPKKPAVLLIGILILYSLSSAAFAAADFSFFLQANILRDTPRWFLAAALLAVCGYAAWSGGENLARLSVFLLPSVILTVLQFTIASASQLRWEHLLPVTWPDAGTLRTALALTSHPGSEPIFLFAIFSAAETKHHPCRPWIGAVLLANALLTLTLLLDTLLLSPLLLERMRWDTYFAAGAIGLGESSAHTEVLSSAVFCITSLFSVSAMLLTAWQCLRTVLPAVSRKWGIPALTAAVFLLSVPLSANQLELYRESVLWRTVSLGIQTLLPAVLGVGAAAKRIRKDYL